MEGREGEGKGTEETKGEENRGEGTGMFFHKSDTDCLSSVFATNLTSVTEEID